MNEDNHQKQIGGPFQPGNAGTMRDECGRRCKQQHKNRNGDVLVERSSQMPQHTMRAAPDLPTDPATTRTCPN